MRDAGRTLVLEGQFLSVPAILGAEIEAVANEIAPDVPEPFDASWPRDYAEYRRIEWETLVRVRAKLMEQVMLARMGGDES